MFYEMLGKNPDSAGIARDVVWFKGASSGTREYLAYESVDKIWMQIGAFLPGVDYCLSCLGVGVKPDRVRYNYIVQQVVRDPATPHYTVPSSASFELSTRRNKELEREKKN